MRVLQIMSSPVSFCRTTDNLNEAAHKMWEMACGALPIVDDSGQVVAMLTDRDICRAAYTQASRFKRPP